jgi:hypothetical protein
MPVVKARLMIRWNALAVVAYHAFLLHAVRFSSVIITCITPQNIKRLKGNVN